METIAEIKIPKKKLLTLFRDNVKSAAAINLVYVSDIQPGIRRIEKGRSFIYELQGKQISDERILGRIRRLVLPPAWQDVWICANEDGHLQATGIDAKGRKQYKYHPLWNSLRNYTKFHHLHEFGKALPAIRCRLEKDLRKHGLPLEKVLATIVSIMQCTCIRVGNSMYEKLYGSFGITTLRNKHVTIKGDSVRFTFRGKKGVFQDVGLKSKQLSNIVRQCMEIPGKELFQYYDEHGGKHGIDSGMVNDYIKEISGGTFTAKDFRTWAGTLHAIEAFKEIGPADNITSTKKNIVTALDMVAKQLGNTRTVCRKYYVHPMVIGHYTNNTLESYLNKFDTITCDPATNLSSAEMVMMNMLEAEGPVMIAA